jgi:hypothetical protein
MDKSSLKSGNMYVRVFQAECLAGNFGGRGQALVPRTISPIGIFLGFHRLEVIISFDLKAFRPAHANSAPGRHNINITKISNFPAKFRLL